jgi:hypothetical protein
MIKSAQTRRSAQLEKIGSTRCGKISKPSRTPKPGQQASRVCRQNQSCRLLRPQVLKRRYLDTACRIHVAFGAMKEYRPIQSHFGPLWIHRCMPLTYGPEWTLRERLIVDAGAKDSRVTFRGKSIAFHGHLAALCGKQQTPRKPLSRQLYILWHARKTSLEGRRNGESRQIAGRRTGRL